MVAVYEKIDKFCRDLKRLGELENLIGQVSNVNSLEVKDYQCEHNQLVKGLNEYVAQNYSGDILSFALDFYRHMVSEKEEAIEEFRGTQMRTMESEREIHRKKVSQFMESIQDFRAFLKEHYSIKGSDG